MSTVSFYRLDTGCFEGARSYSGDWPDENTPPGFGWVAGVHDHLRKRVETATGNVVDYQPPMPPADAMRSWAWDEVSKQWVCAPTDAAQVATLRSERDRRLGACDWVTLRAIETGAVVPVEWQAYRRALRDLPKQPGFPSLIDWPASPS